MFSYSEACKLRGSGEFIDVGYVEYTDVERQQISVIDTRLRDAVDNDEKTVILKIDEMTEKVALGYKKQGWRIDRMRARSCYLTNPPRYFYTSWRFYLP